MYIYYVHRDLFNYTDSIGLQLPLLPLRPRLEDIRDKELARLVRTPDQGATGHVQEAEFVASQLPLLELGRRHVLVHLQMATRRLHVLSQGEAVDAHLAQLPHRLLHLVVRLAQSQHDRRLGDDVGAQALGGLQHGQRLPITRPTISDERGQLLDRFDVVRKNVEAGIDDTCEAVQVAAKVRTEHLDEYLWVARLDLVHGGGNVLGATVLEV